MIAVAFAAHFVSGGFTFYAYSVLFTAFMEDFDASRLQISTGVILTQLAVALCSVFAGVLLDRRSIARVMALGAALLGAGFLIASYAPGLWAFYLVQGTLIGAGSAMLGNIAPSTLVSKWYDRNRGTALGISQLGISASGLVMAGLAAWLAVRVGWRGTYVVFGLFSVLVMAPLLLAVVVSRPEDVGQRPDGELPPAASAHGPARERIARPEHWSAPLRQRAFWAIVLTIGLVSGVNGGVGLHLPAHVEALGLGRVVGGAALSLTAGAAMVSKPVYGRLFDRMDHRVAPTLTALMQAAGLVLLLLTESTTGVLAASAVFGLGLGGVAPLLGALVGAAFGRERFGRVSGLLSPLMLPFSLGGMALSGLLADRTGGYALSFQIMLVGAIAGALAIQLYRVGPARDPAAPA